MSKENNFYFFKINEAELARQVEQHDTLSITESARGKAVLTILGLLVFGIVVVFALPYLGSPVTLSFTDVLGSLIIYAPFVYLTYKGNRYGIVLLGILYTLDKIATQALVGQFNVGAIFFWIAGIGPLWVAFKVEQAYRKKKALSQQVILNK